jgi:hypothetical protein
VGIGAFQVVITVAAIFIVKLFFPKYILLTGLTFMTVASGLLGALKFLLDGTVVVMYIYVCMCVCACVSVWYVYVYISVHIFIVMYMCVCVCVCVGIGMSVNEETSDRQTDSVTM